VTCDNYIRFVGAERVPFKSQRAGAAIGSIPVLCHHSLVATAMDFTVLRAT
jgi:hypothetical protein